MPDRPMQSVYFRRRSEQVSNGEGQLLCLGAAPSPEGGRPGHRDRK